MKIIFLFIIASFAIKINTSGQSTSLPDSTISQLKKGIEGFKDRYHSPSIVVAIIHDQDIIFTEALGYTDVNKKIPATVDSKYPILSITKMFTATMLMQLTQRNQVRLEDDVSRYVPEFKAGSQPDRQTGTSLLQLATHTSGLPRNSQADIKFAKQVDRWILAGSNDSVISPANNKEFLESLRFIKKEYPEYQLLSYSDRQYSNLGYSLLGIALERAAKAKYEAYVKREIFHPLHMNSSGFDSEPLKKDDIATGYFYNDSLDDAIETPRFKSNSALYNGGMYTTATDLAKFISFQFNNSAASDKILSVKNKAMMQSLRIGWKPSFPFVLHEGAMLGYRAQIILNPAARLGWVILTNTTDFDFSRMNEYINSLVLPLFSKKPSTDLEKFTGDYKLEGGYDSLTIYIRDGKLYSTYLQNFLPETALIHDRNNRFRAQGKSSYNIGYDFIANDKNEIRSLVMGQLTWTKQ